jgi:FkbM family methyltransferase
MVARLFRLLPPRAVQVLERLVRTWPFTAWPLKVLVRKGMAQILSGEATVKHGPGAGLRLEATGAKAAFTVGTDEPAVQEELVRVLRPGSVVYDVGANVGFMTLIAARLVGPTGHVYAFEPIPENARAIERNAALNNLENITVLELALSDRAGEAVLRIPQMNQGAHLAAVGAAVGEEDDLTVQTAALDELRRTREIRPPDLVKLDVEGAELLVLGGMRACLAESKPALVCELHGTRGAIEELLPQLGYEITRIVRDTARDAWNEHAFARGVGPGATPPSAAPFPAPDATQ